MASKLTARQLIDRLGLERHPEGGWFRETYRSNDSFDGAALPDRFGGERSFSTAIYFLLEQGDFSALHRIGSDEVWHFYCGAALAIHVIEPGGGYRRVELGEGTYQAVVAHGCWFGAEVAGDGDFALVGCTVSPGFDFADFEMGDRDKLLEGFPQHAEIINKMTR